MNIEKTAKELWGLRKEDHDIERRLTQDLLKARSPEERMAAVDRREAEKTAARQEAEECAREWMEYEGGIEE